MRQDLVQMVLEAYRSYAAPSARVGTADSEDRMYDRSAGVLDAVGVERVLFKCGESCPALNFLYLAEANGELDGPVEEIADARITLGGFVRVLHAQDKGQFMEFRQRAVAPTGDAEFGKSRRHGVNRGRTPHMDTPAAQSAEDEATEQVQGSSKGWSSLREAVSKHKEAKEGG